MKIEFLAEAKAELDEAVQYYELQTKGLGAIFKSTAKSTIKRVATFPTAWTMIRPNIRRCIMHKFPYNVLYSIEEILNLDISKYQLSLVLRFGYRVNERSSPLRLSFKEVVEFIK